MNTVFDDTTRAGLIARIETLTGDENARWGKMNVSQMLEHSIRWEEITAGQIKIKRAWIGYLFGKAALKSLTGDEKPLNQSTPTLKELIVEETTGDIETQKQKWTDLLKAYQNTSAEYFMHPFFGKMTREQTGILSYKHTDHHLRQFGR